MKVVREGLTGSKGRGALPGPGTLPRRAQLRGPLARALLERELEPMEAQGFQIQCTLKCTHEPDHQLNILEGALPKLPVELEVPVGVGFYPC